MMTTIVGDYKELRRRLNAAIDHKVELARDNKLLRVALERAANQCSMAAKVKGIDAATMLVFMEIARQARETLGVGRG